MESFDSMYIKPTARTILAVSIVLLFFSLPVQATTTLVESPTVWGETDNTCTNPSFAQSSDNSYAQCGNSTLESYGDYGFSISGDSVVDSVEVGIEYYSGGDDNLQLQVSADGGSTWESTHAATYKSSDDDTVEWINVTSDASWDATTLKDSNFKVRVKYNFVSTNDWVYYDWIPVRVTISDGGGGGNTAPTAEITFPDTGSTVSGSDVSGTYVLTDPDDDPGTVTIEVSDDDGSTWDTDATVSGDINSVSSSSSGDSHSFTWDSLADLGNVTSSSVQLRARATDGMDTGSYTKTGSFTVDNGDGGGSSGGDSTVYSPTTWGNLHDQWDNPSGADTTTDNNSVAANSYAREASDGQMEDYGSYGITVPSGSSVDSVEVGTEYFAESDDEIQFEVSGDGGNTWETTHTATVKTSDDDTVEWIDVTGDTNWNATTLNNSNFKVRVIYNYTGTNAANWIDLDWIPVRVKTSPDNTAPTTDLVFPDTGSLVSGDAVSGTYVLTDPDDDPGTVTIEVSDDDASTWDTDATVSGDINSVSSSSSGDSHSFTWDSLADLGNVNDTNIKLRIRTFDGTDTGSYDTSGAFTVDNRAPPKITDVSSTAAINPPDTGVHLRWTFASNDVDTFHVYRSHRTGDTSQADLRARVSPTTDTPYYQDASVTQGDSYFYYVTAVDTAGNRSDSSNRTTSPYVSFTKTNNQSSARPGDTVVYEIEYVNEGFGPSGRVRINDALPSNTVLSDSATVLSPPPDPTIGYSPDNGSSWQSSSYPREIIDQVRWTIDQELDPRATGNHGTVQFEVKIQ